MEQWYGSAVPDSPSEDPTDDLIGNELTISDRVMLQDGSLWIVMGFPSVIHPTTFKAIRMVTLYPDAWPVDDNIRTVDFTDVVKYDP